MISFLSRVLLVLALTFMGATSVFAQATPVGGGSIPGSGGPTPVGSGSIPSEGDTLKNPLQAGTLQAFIVNVLQVVVQLGSIIVILMLIYVGFMFVTAQGDIKKIIEARQALLYTVIGALILLGAQVIAMGIQATVQALATG